MPEADVEGRRPQHLASCGVGYLYEKYAHLDALSFCVEESVSLLGVCGSWSVRFLHPAVACCGVLLVCVCASSQVVSESSAGLRCCGERVVCEAFDSSVAAHSERRFCQVG